MTVQWFPVAELGAIPKNEGRKVSFGEIEIALFNLGEEYRAVDNRCPHKQGPLADGIVSGKSVFCPLHSLNVSLENGCAIRGAGCVKVYPAKVMGARVCVAFYEGKQ
ncbi:MAG: nitrite reductase (NAD(P)H) small subunit [Candidatus Omnitrophica bacterium]|nr:nitrite reductase (NAD(P)H) small subunit [Candidatus Omnitrophota bacterium]